MSPSEALGRSLLRQAFESAGFTIQEDYLLDFDGLRVTADGYDPDARVGYEYVTLEDGHSRLSGADLARLEGHLQSGLARLFLIDENDVENGEQLVRAAWDFLDAL